VNSEQECLGLCNGLDTCVGVSIRYFFAPDNFGCWLKSASCSEEVGSCNVQNGWCFFEKDNVQTKSPTAIPSSEPSRMPTKEPTAQPTSEPIEDTDEVNVEGYTGLVADCFGNAIGSRLTVNSEQECLGLCNGLDTCVGVSIRYFFAPDNFGCWLKSASCSEEVGSCNVQNGWCFFEKDNVQTKSPTAIPSSEPSRMPTKEPTAQPTSEPTEEITSHELLKSMVKTAFDNIKSPENKSALPGLIRKAFHDAGHFDKSSGDVRMGCIQHFLSGSNACPQHAHLEEAESVVNAVMDQIPSGLLSMADAVQLLGALAVDELAQDTGAPLLYDRVRTGRVDPQAEECIDNQGMCDNLPAFFTKHHSEVDHDDIVASLNDVWVQEIEGKMIDVNSLSKQDAVALIGAHTVGRHFDFGHWTQQPNIFDNEYFVQLKRVKDWLDSENELGENAGHPFGADVRSNWWIDSELVEDPNAVFPASRIMMLDADLTLVLNAPELVEKYAADLFAWRKDFDDAYIVMSELGFSTLEPPIEGGSDRRLLQRSDELLDEDFEFFQNLQIRREEQVEKIHATFRRKM